MLYHLFLSDDVSRFRVRGALQLRGGRETSVSLSQSQLSEEDRNTLKVGEEGRGRCGLEFTVSNQDFVLNLYPSCPSDTGSGCCGWSVQNPSAQSVFDRQADRAPDGWLPDGVRQSGMCVSPS